MYHTTRKYTATFILPAKCVRLSAPSILCVAFNDENLDFSPKKVQKKKLK